MLGHENYVASIRNCLVTSLCLRDFPSVTIEKDNKPYVELEGVKEKMDNLVMAPIYLARNKKEKFLIEPSINSCRISFTIKQSDQIDRLIANKLSLMMAARASLFEILRRKPLDGYDLTLLITNETLEKYRKDLIIDLIISLATTLEKDLLEVKLNINTQSRIASTYLMDHLANPSNDEEIF